MRISQSKWMFCLGLSIAAQSAACAVDDSGELELSAEDSEIVGGTNTTIAQNPWQIALTTNAAFQFCGGSIVSASWVLTAQHCVDGGNADMRVVAGITQKSQQASGQIRAIDAVVTFPGYSDASLGKDVALVHLATPLTFGTNVAAIPLVTAADATAGALNGGVNSRVTGWGTLSSGGSTPDILQTVDVPLITHAQAQAAYGTLSTDQLGAGVLGVGGRDSCQGDSGGPLSVVFNGVRKLGGVVSWGEGCALANKPGMYAKVSSFQAWIAARTGGAYSALLNLSALSGARNAFTHRTVTVPAGAKSLSVVVRGGTGDADLYVRRSTQPTTGAYDCRPYQGGNAEFCSFDSPAAGTWYVSMRGFSAYSGATLTVSVVQ
jgi:secreted trypsin-like serine protease